jgi:hypothetical protein
MSDARKRQHPGGRRLAAPPTRDTASWSAPTPERRAKALEGLAVAPQPGGLKTYRALTPYQANEQHFTAREQAAALRFLHDMEAAGRIRIVSARVYTGMPSYNGACHLDRPRAQAEAAERVDWILRSMDERWLAFLNIVLMGVQFEREGKAWSLEELGGRLSRYTGKDQRRACAVGFAKGAFVRLDEAYAAWAVEFRRRRQAAGQQRAAAMAAKAEVAITHVQTQWAAERELALANGRSTLLQAYDAIVLGKCTPRPRRRVHDYAFEVTLDRVAA